MYIVNIFLLTKCTFNVIFILEGRNINMTLSERIKEVRTSSGDTQTKFAEKLSISRSAVSKIESGENTPSSQTIALICKIYNINYQWLVNGNGEMFKENDIDAQAAVDELMTGDNEFAKNILVKLARLSEERWKQIEEILDELELK
ncbi:XRE family transcriptional regulator [Anaerobutyricum hallii]|uniref:XRE family transcriptional regulator n=2 Tax=Anaerobutyricum hallii TaxID=39488 RepID=A0A415UCN7_9FIRM|nr:XRE family transcriptional regulator [Anaerobutyricum hallii]RHN15870.1 XRE family transcriptional regulator [Anaerobutyricum hallii]